MKIEITQTCTIARVEYGPGIKITVLNELGKNLIESGFAKSSEYVSSHEKIAEDKKNQQLLDILEEMPDAAVDIVDYLKTCENEDVLNHFVTDSRSTVQNAAKKRIEALN